MERPRCDSAPRMQQSSTWARSGVCADITSGGSFETSSFAKPAPAAADMESSSTQFFRPADHLQEFIPAAGRVAAGGLPSDFQDVCVGGVAFELRVAKQHAERRDRSGKLVANSTAATACACPPVGN